MAVPNITLDTNCLYELETEQPAPSLRELVALGRAGLVLIRIPAIAASELQRNGRSLSSFQDFQRRIANLDLGFADLLRPLAYIDMAYIDWCLWSGPDEEAQERAIHEALFPTIAFRAADHCPSTDPVERRRWRNAKCDVQAMWCHINYGSGIFVTRDRNFHKRSRRSTLAALGAGVIATPEEVLVHLAESGISAGVGDPAQPDAPPDGRMAGRG